MASKSIKVGHATIFPQQVKAARECVKVLFARESPAFLSAEMQQGKTGASICVANDVFERAVKQGKTLHVIVIIADSRDDLKNQTFDRFNNGKDELGVKEGASLSARMEMQAIDYKLDIVHRSGLKKVEVADHDWRLIIIDESHIGEVETSALAIHGEINRFLARVDVKLSESPDSWKRGRTTNYLMLVSATGFSCLLAGRNYDTFTHVHMDRSPIYVGIPELLEKRIMQLESRIMAGSEPSEFFRNTILFRLDKETKKNGPGYCIIRLSGEQKEDFIRWCKRPEVARAHVEASSACGNIADINPMLMRKPNETTFLIISGSFRAGMTYSTEEHIRMVVETTSTSTKNTEALLQSVGRSCGNGKGKYTYPIFCNRNQLMRDGLLYIKSLRAGGEVHIPKTSKMKAGSGEKIVFSYAPRITGAYDSNVYTVKRQSRYVEDLSKVIRNGSKHLGYGSKKKLVIILDQLFTKAGKSLAYPEKIGTYAPAGVRLVSLDMKDNSPYANSSLN